MLIIPQYAVIIPQYAIIKLYQSVKNVVISIGYNS